MDKKKSSSSGSQSVGYEQQFISVTKHLKDKDFKLLKDDVGLFNIPESWDLQFENDNRSAE